MSNFIWSSHFACIAVIDNKLIPNSYALNLSMETLEKKTNLGLGYRKLKYFIEHNLHNSILISQEHPKLDYYSQIDNNVVVLPNDPWDYLIGCILYYKFTNITEKYFDLLYLTIDSAMGDNVKYTIDQDVDPGVDIEGEKWWNVDSPSIDISVKTSWEKLNLKDVTGFSPKIIKGGLYTK